MTDPLPVREPFHDASQQHEADLMGMYIFLASEIMLFGGLFAALLAYRILYRSEVVEASRHLHIWIGTVNTAALLTSSLLVAVAVQAARQAWRRLAAGCLVGTVLLGFVFLGLKAIEYRAEYAEGLLPIPGARRGFSGPIEALFMDLYLVATGLHAFHLVIGIVLLLGLSWRLLGQSLPLPQRSTTVAMVGLYWHLVDIIWVFLFPVLYLAR